MIKHFHGYFCDNSEKLKTSDSDLMNVFGCLKKFQYLSILQIIRKMAPKIFVTRAQKTAYR